MASYSDIDSKLEDALIVVITAKKGTAIGNTAINAADQGAEKVTLPRIAVIVDEAENEIISGFYTGNYNCSVKAMLLTNYEKTTRAERNAMKAELGDIMMRDDMVSLLNAAGIADFTVKGTDTLGRAARKGWIPRGFTKTTREHAFAVEFTAECYCKPS